LHCRNAIAPGTARQLNASLVIANISLDRRPLTLSLRQKKVDTRAFTQFLATKFRFHKMAEVGAPKQFKQSSRKGKKAWRKNVDVTDLQEGLEVVRDETIKGYYIPYSPRNL
jgi:Nop53 (60S ribosomal biogenesis)